MATRTTIEWTQMTWNPVTGCIKISPGCKHCYAERMTHRLHAMSNPRYEAGFTLTLHDDLVDLPTRWRQPRRFVSRRRTVSKWYWGPTIPSLMSDLAAIPAALAITGCTTSISWWMARGPDCA